MSEKKSVKKYLSLTQKMFLGVIAVLLMNLTAVFIIFISQTNTVSKYNYQVELESVSPMVAGLLGKNIMMNDDISQAVGEIKELYPYMVAVACNDQLLYSDFLTQKELDGLLKSKTSPANIGGKRYFFVISPIDNYTQEDMDYTLILAKDIPMFSPELEKALYFSGICIALIRACLKKIFHDLFQKNHSTRQIYKCLKTAA